MTQIINGLLIPAYNLSKGKDYYSGSRIDEQDAKKNFKLLLTELTKVSIAVGGFFAVSAVMKRMSTPLSVGGAGSFLLGGALLFSPKISIILRDTSLMTASLFVLQKGFIDQLIIPIIHSVKAVGLFLYQTRVASIWELTADNLFSAVLSGSQKIGIGFLRCLGGLTCLAVAYSLIASHSEKVSKSQKLLDKVFFNCIRKMASGMAHFFYRSSPPPFKPNEQKTSSFQLFRREI